ncbi:MAG: M48 family metallopeptidase [Clostridia bacterium]|nr:M48 family metallopeptidase [Clostridia bacterium]
MKFSYDVIRSKRKTISISVDAECNITVRAPLKMSDREIESFVFEKKKWLEKAVAEQMRKSKNTKSYSEEEIKLLRRKAKEIIPQKVDYYSTIMGVEPAGVKINSARKRYGSCSGTNSLNFSLFLMDKDERFIDYVVVHELAHIVHHNHSKAFYAFIEKFMPDYKERSKL